MKHVAVAVALGLAFAAPARADGTLQVHLDASSKVVLERVDEDGDAALACRAPCDVALDADALYRIDGDGLRPSSPFHLRSADGQRVVITPRSSRRLVRSPPGSC